MSIQTEGELVTWVDVQDIELVVVRRMREYMTGTHGSVFQGDGFDVVGLRDWQPGDRVSSIDWPQSSLTNFSPLSIREFEQQSTARIVIVADTSLSTYCGSKGVRVATVIARTVATLALAGAFFQDHVGLITFDGRSRQMSVPPGAGKRHAIRCLDIYQKLARGEIHLGLKNTDDSLSALLRKTSMVPVVSDFLFEDYERLLDEIRELNTMHDAFIVVVDCWYAFALPAISAGWVEGYDVETGQSSLMSADDVRRLSARVDAWQDNVAKHAHERGLDVLRLCADADQCHDRLVEFLVDRRRRKR